MRTRRLVMLVTWMAVFAMAARISVDTDTWWHLRAGTWILEHRAIPQTDPFSYTRAGAAWQYPGWLVEVPMVWIYRVLGPGGLNLWTAALVTLTFVFLWPTLTGGVFTRAFVIVLAAAASGVYWAARPYLVTFLLTAVFLWILEDHRQMRANRVWWLVPLMAVWANSHGGFIIGFVVWGVYGLRVALERCTLERCTFKRESLKCEALKRSTFRRFFLVGIGMLLAVCLNPSGPVMLLYPFKTVSIGSLREYIQEWQSPDFHSLQVQPFLWLFLLTLAAVGFSRRRLSLVDFLLLAGFGYLAFLAGRNIALFALVAPMVLTRHLDPTLRALSRRLGVRLPDQAARPLSPARRALNWTLVVVLALAVLVKVSLVFPLEANQSYFRETFPVEAVAFIQRERPPGRLFNSYNWGGYLLWALPEYPVFIDGRTDLYDDEVIQDWLTVVRAEDGWEMLLEYWDVNLVLIEPGMPLAQVLADHGWQRLYVDDRVVIFGRKLSGYGSVMKLNAPWVEFVL